MDSLLDNNDMQDSLDMVSLFTRVQLQEILELLMLLFPRSVAALFHQVLTSTYFMYDGKYYYEQIAGVVMGSSLSPVIMNFYVVRR